MNTTQIIILTTIINTIITGLVGGVVIYVVQKKIDATLQKSLFEYQTKFARAYPRTLEVLETFNQKYLHFRTLSFQFSHEIAAVLLSSKKAPTDEEIDKKEEELYSALSGCHSYLENNRIYLPAESIIQLADINAKAGDLLELLIAARYFQDTSKIQLGNFMRRAAKYESLRLIMKNPQRTQNIHFDYRNQICAELDGLLQQLEKHYKSVAEAQ